MGTQYKIAFFMHSLAGGGTEKVMINILRRIDRAKFYPQLILMLKKGEFLEEVPKDVPIYSLERTQLRDVLISLIKVLHCLRPHILIAVSEYANVIALLAAYMSLTGMKKVLTFHRLVSLPKKISDYSPREKVVFWISRRIFPRVDGIVAVSRGVAEDVSKIFSIPLSKIKVIYNPVVDEHIISLSREEVKHPWFREHSHPIIISVGSLTAGKGHRYLLEGVKKLVQRIPVHVVILGQGPEEKNLRLLSRRLGIEKFVDFLGFQKNPYKFIAKSDLFVLPSLWEGFGLAVIEAMACGIPVITTNCKGGIKEIFSTPEEGCLVPPADSESLYKSILKLLTDKQLYQQMKEKGRKRAQEFRVDKIVREYEEFFMEILRRNKKEEGNA